MGEEKLEDVPKRQRKLAICGRCVAVGSVLVLARIIMRVRDRRRERLEQERRHHRFPLFGH
jgi:hypothetical protein